MSRFVSASSSRSQDLSLFFISFHWWTACSSLSLSLSFLADSSFLVSRPFGLARSQPDSPPPRKPRSSSRTGRRGNDPSSTHPLEGKELLREREEKRPVGWLGMISSISRVGSVASLSFCVSVSFFLSLSPQVALVVVSSCDHFFDDDRELFLTRLATKGG